MKIIKRGTLPADRKWKFECTHCRTTFECAQCEGQLISDQRDGDTLKVPCPVCKSPCYGSPK